MFAAIYIPDFFLQAVLRHEPELASKPVALVNDDTPRSPIWQPTASARQLGVSPGMTSTQAKARCEEIAFRLRSIPQEEAAQEILIECVYLSAAYLEATAPGVCTADLRGLPVLKAKPLAPALDHWAKEMRKRLQAFHLESRIGVASAPALALQASQGDQAFCYVSDAKKFWSALPVQNLDAPSQTLEVLRKWGIRTAAEFLSLSKARIAERLGEAGVQLYDRTRADSPRPLRLTSPRGQYSEFFEFEQFIETLEPLLFMVRRLLDQLAQRIGLLGRSINEIAIDLHLESGGRHAGTLRIPAPTRDSAVLFRIAHNYLETVRTPSPVVALTVEAEPCETETQQFQLFETSVRDPNRFYETIGRLGALLGSDRVGTPVLRDSHKPEDFEMVAPSEKPPAALNLSDPRPPPRGLALRRFRPPLRAAVRLKNGAPIFVQTEGPSGAVIDHRGPWRSSGNWWEQLWARDEWDVQIKEGGLYRLIFTNNEWLLEGSYD